MAAHILSIPWKHTGRSINGQVTPVIWLRVSSVTTTIPSLTSSDRRLTISSLAITSSFMGNRCCGTFPRITTSIMQTHGSGRGNRAKATLCGTRPTISRQGNSLVSHSLKDRWLVNLSASSTITGLSTIDLSQSHHLGKFSPIR